MTQHTPVPWTNRHPAYYAEELEQILGPDGELIACYVTPENAKHIVTACNSHLPMIDVLEAIVSTCKDSRYRTSMTQNQMIDFLEGIHLAAKLTLDKVQEGK